MQLEEGVLHILAEMVCGAHGTNGGFEWNNFPYRTSTHLTRFFRSCGLPQYVHDGSTRNYWVFNVLYELNAKASPDSLLPSPELTRVIERLVHPLEFVNTDLDRIAATEDLNNVLRAAGMSFELDKEGRLRLQGVDFLDRGVREAAILLSDSRFAGPDEQFRKAVDFLRGQPTPDVENCIKDAVGALEAVAQLLAGKHSKEGLPRIMDRLSSQGIIPGSLAEGIKKVYGYRGDTPGVAHGMTQKQATADEAELVLNMCATYIVYLARKLNLDQRKNHIGRRTKGSVIGKEIPNG